MLGTFGMREQGSHFGRLLIPYRETQIETRPGASTGGSQPVPCGSYEFFDESRHVLVKLDAPS